uniref:Reverse transcriptase zinc-binding domain-containing protein n=1 Tax=Lactuca sativa TaxID=4236 RepID=A0A9R1W1C8_LACSA|nr:hypothetical protein LSAT_V11C300132620 [Lactuca sativa]
MNSVLRGLPFYYFVFFKSPKKVIELLESITRNLRSSESRLKNLFMRHLEDGKDTFFWKDKWCGALDLKHKYSKLYKTESNKNCKVNDCILSRGEVVLDWS